MSATGEHGPFLEVTVDNGVALLRMNRPATRNAISDDDAIDSIVATLDGFSRRDDVKALVLTGAGSAFSSGGNLATLQEFSGTAAPSLRNRYREGIQRIPLAFERLEIPAIAAVNGAAVGAGCDLACMCDIRIGSTLASFAESFIMLGIVPGDGGAWLLPRAVGMARACEMAFTGDPVDADKALRWGLVTEVVEPEQLMPAAMKLAQRIARHSGPALRMTKRLLRESALSRLDTVLELSASFQALAHQTPEHKSALDAMVRRLAAKKSEAQS